MIRVVALNLFPVKGCAGTSLPQALMTPAGLAHDRAFMVTDEHGTFRSQRRDPRLALITPEIGPDGGVLSLRADGFGEVEVPVDTTGPRRDVDLFGRPYRGIDQGDAAARWLSEVLGAGSRLVRVPPEHERVTDGQIPGTCGYADSSPVHLLSVASFDGLNARIAAGGGEPLPMDRFRPNIVVDTDTGAGVAEAPHYEDRLRRVTIGGTELGYAKPALRCVVTTVDQRHGVKRGPEPLRTLAAYRRAPGGGTAFGVKLAVLVPGKLSVGDEVTVAEWGEPEV